ncbi:hypothetical protein MBLNU230_g5695t1 [Neophaeotheca triangularis]
MSSGTSSNGDSTAKAAAAILNASRQATFFATGTLAGLSGTTALQLITNLPSIQHFKPLLTSPALPKAGLRFWTFDLVRRHTPSSTPTTLKSALGGAAGGFLEECAHALASRRAPVPLTVVSQTLRLFLCFGTYTYLSTTLSPERLPPRPFWWCWGMGAVAGAVGNTVASGLVEGVRGRRLWLAAPKGAVLIGTVIAVQVTTCAAVLERVER